MVISYLGGQCFKVSQGDLTLAFNPPSKDSALKASKFGSDIVLVSQNHEDFNGVENASFGDREPFAVWRPQGLVIEAVLEMRENFFRAAGRGSDCDLMFPVDVGRVGDGLAVG